MIIYDSHAIYKDNLCFYLTVNLTFYLWDIYFTLYEFVEKIIKHKCTKKA